MSSSKYGIPERLVGPEFIVAAEIKTAIYTAKRKKIAATSRRGNAPIFTAGLLPRRNGACPCGSGRKYKHCCRRALPVIGDPTLPSQADLHAKPPVYS